MKLLLLPLDPGLASSRLRIVELAPHLEARGIECDVETYPRTFGAQRALRRRASEYDAVVVQKRLPSRFEAGPWRVTGVPCLFDFDDALPFRQRPKHGSHESATRRRRFARILRLADAFVCGNANLATLVGETNKPVEVIPTAVPVDVPRHEHLAEPAPLRVGWIGGQGNLEDLERLRGPLAAVARTHPLELVVISDAPWDAADVPVRHVPWSLAGQADALASLDVGLMPLADNAWNRGKCAYKLLQYMAAGVCAIGAPVGMNAQLIEHGRNGLLARDDDEWTEVLRQAATDAALRGRLGAAGRATVERDYSFAAVAERWARLLERVLA